MPFFRFELIEGRSDADIAVLLDTAHAVVLEVFGVPPRDRYQIVQEHAPSRMRIEDTGLGIARTNDFVMVHVSTRPRPVEQKVRFYEALCAAWQTACAIAPSDVMIVFLENTDADWSFGHGEAQFLTGKL